MKTIDLRKAMEGLQKQMEAKLTLSRSMLTHPTAVGDVSELEWVRLLADYLPRRYCVEKGFVVDHKGNVSDQIDLLVYDKQYTPFIFHLNGVKYIPAEAIYAAIECKQEISKKNLQYAAAKAKSIRRLTRTSLKIKHAGGEYPPKTPHNILCGLVCLDGELNQRAISYLEKASSEEAVNFVCSLSGTYGRIQNYPLWSKAGPPHQVQATRTTLSLVYFVMNLIAELQAIGTVAAIDVTKYLPS